MLLLLAINIFPLIWTVRLSFTNFRAKVPNPDSKEGFDVLEDSKVRGILKSWSAFFTRSSKAILYSLIGVFRFGSRFAQKSWMKRSASSSDAIFFHSFCSESMAR